MSPIHFELLEPAFRASGYNLVVLGNDNKNAVNAGLKYVNNDACYPSLITVGMFMDAVTSGKYDNRPSGDHHVPRPAAAAVPPTTWALSAARWKRLATRRSP